ARCPTCSRTSRSASSTTAPRSRRARSSRKAEPVALATTERAAICAAFAEVGPDRPTLCGDWSTHDLLAHLLVRERQPWSSGGILVKALEPITEKAMQGYAATPWTEMIESLRTGPPIWSPFWLSVVDRFANAAEFFVHHEDVRR